MSMIENCSLTDNMENKAIRDHHRALFAEMVKKTGSHQSVLDRMLQELAEVTKQRDELLAACEKTISENGHLADGDVCTLIDFKRAIASVKANESAGG